MKQTKVDLTKVQCEALAEFIELNFLDAIRNDPDIDNLEWVKAMMTALDVLNKAVEDDG